MKMDILELDTFIQKFKQLWHSGVDLHTHAGQAWVNLHVRLGHAPGPLHLQPQSNLPPKPKSKNSPTRQQRRAKRAVAAQHKQAEEASKEDTEKVQTVENTTIGKPTEKVIDKFCPDDVYHSVYHSVDGIGQEVSDVFNTECCIFQHHMWMEIQL